MNDHLATLIRSIAGGIAFVGLGGLAFNADPLISIILLSISGIILFVVSDIRKGKDND
jgi:hypothetical protein